MRRTRRFRGAVCYSVFFGDSKHRVLARDRRIQSSLLLEGALWRWRITESHNHRSQGKARQGRTRQDKADNSQTILRNDRVRHEDGVGQQHYWDILIPMIIDVPCNLQLTTYNSFHCQQWLILNYYFLLII